MKYFSSLSFFVLGVLLCLSGCARRVTLNADEPRLLPHELDVSAVTLSSPDLAVQSSFAAEVEDDGDEPLDVEGVYHKVEKGQTLWRISKMYNVSLDELIRVNHISDVAQVETHQMVLIPGVNEIQEEVLEPDLNQNEFVWPIRGRIVKYFNQSYGKSVNKGINIEIGSANKVCASRSGRVVFSDYLVGYGYTVILDHDDGYQTVYAQNEDLLVKADQEVLKNMPIALASYDSGSEIHFQIRKNSVEDNPLHYLPKYSF